MANLTSKLIAGGAVFIALLMLFVPFVSVSDSEGTVSQISEINDVSSIEIDNSTDACEYESYAWNKDSTTGTLTLKGSDFWYISVDISLDLNIVLQGKNKLYVTGSHYGIDVSNTGNITVSGGELEINLGSAYYCGLHSTYASDFDDNGSHLITVKNAKITVNALVNEDGTSSFINAYSSFTAIDSSLYGYNINFGIDLDTNYQNTITIKNTYIEFDSPYMITDVLDSFYPIVTDVAPTGDGLLFYQANGDENNQWGNDVILVFSSGGKFVLTPPGGDDGGPNVWLIVGIVAVIVIAAAGIGFYFFNKKKQNGGQPPSV